MKILCYLLELVLNRDYSPHPHRTPSMPWVGHLAVFRDFSSHSWVGGVLQASSGLDTKHSAIHRMLYILQCTAQLTYPQCR